MKLVVSSLAQLFLVVVLVLTFAVSLAALSLWADSGTQNVNADQQASGLGAGTP